MSAALSENGSGGTNGSSAAVRISAGTRDPIDDAERRGAVVVVGRRRESRSAAPCRPRRSRARCGCARSGSSEKRSGKGRDLAPHPRLQVPHEVPLVERVRRPLERVDARGRSITGDTATTPRSQGGGAAAMVAGELQRQVAAKRITRDDERVDGPRCQRRSSRRRRPR